MQEDGLSLLVVGCSCAMAESPPSFQQDTDPTECDEVKRKLCKPCSVGHSQMVPAALQFQVDTSELTLVEKVEMVKKMNFEAADIFILMHRIKEGEKLVIVKATNQSTYL